MSLPTLPVQQRPMLRVLIVDDSSICRASLRGLLQADGDIEVVGEGEDAFAAISLVETLAPDLVTIDVQMPGKSGLEAVEQIMARRPVPILMMTGNSLEDESGVAFTALENGALDVVAKPSITDEAGAADLRALVRRLARTPVFHRVPPDQRATPLVGASAAVVEWITVIAGAGGMPSVLGMLSRAGARMRCPIVVHQPVARELRASYVADVARVAKGRVVVAEDGVVRCEPGTIVLVLDRHAACTSRGTLTVGRREPSASALIASVAEVYGGSALAVVLAGRGADGIDGLRALRARHGLIFVESPLSATVPELPLGTVTADLADAILGLDDLAERLMAFALV